MLEIPTQPYGTLDLISADDHIVEPAHLWSSRAPARLKDRVPTIVTGDDGVEAWKIGERLVPNSGLSAAAGRSYQEFSGKALNFGDMRAGCYDPKERVKDMDLDGVLASVAFPTIAGFGGDEFMRLADAELRHALIRAYNDWLVEEYQAAAPGRLIGCGILPMNEPELAVKELERITARGIRTITVPATMVDIPAGRSLADPAFDRLWSACEERGVPVNVHIASGRRSDADVLRNALPGMAQAFMTSAPLANFNLLAEIIWGGLLERHPRIKFVSSEGGIGWVPSFMERADAVYKKHRYWLQSELTMKPSEYFRRQCYVAFIDDIAGIHSRHFIGVENILWESDYPHTDTSWPNSHAHAAESLAGIPADEYRRITFENARGVFGLG
jgi:predicted TIM-barrel fold metal-dependent hydrolase